MPSSTVPSSTIDEGSGVDGVASVSEKPQSPYVPPFAHPGVPADRAPTMSSLLLIPKGIAELLSVELLSGVYGWVEQTLV
jgi:hypothetical protein